MNYTDLEIPYTRIIEHKHFEFNTQSNKTIITREYPDFANENKEIYYPINNDKNNSLYEKYKTLANNDKNIIFGGRLGQYKYYDMHKVIEEALACAKNELE